MYNIAITKLSTTQLATNPFRWAWDSSHYVPLTQPCHLQLLRKIQLMSSLKMKRQTTTLSAFSTSTNRFMTYWTEPILSTSNTMINIGCHTTSRQATMYGYICKRSASLDPTTSFTRSDMGHTQPQRLQGTIPSSSVFHHSLVYTQYSMWIAFIPTFHLYQTPLTLQNNSHQQS